MEFTNIFVVYDPTRKEQPALERAAAIAGETSARLHLFACIHSKLPKSSQKGKEIEKLLLAQQEQLDSAVKPLVDRGMFVTTELEWDKNWYHAVVRASVKKASDVVMKSTYRHSPGQRILNKSSDWTLIRECLCPVLLVKEGEQRDIRKVLAAIDIRAERESHEDLNQKIIDLSKRIMDSQSAEVHFINAHKDLASFPDRNALIVASGAENDRVHIKLGNTEEVIVEQARELDASLVVIGNSGRSGLSAVLQGNTVEKVLDKLDCDLLAMP